MPFIHFNDFEMLTMMAALKMSIDSGENNLKALKEVQHQELIGVVQERIDRMNALHTKITEAFKAS